MGGTGWGWRSRVVSHQLNWGVLTAGKWTIDMRTPLPSWSSSARTDSKKPRQANLEAQYADWSGMPMNARADPTLTMLPRSRGRMRARAAVVPHTWPRKVTSTARLKSSGDTSHAGEKTVVIASFTHTSIGPSSSSAFDAAASTSSKTATSVGMARARPPARRTSAAAASRPAAPLASRATSKPRSARAVATALPTPADAPVTAAILRWATAPPVDRSVRVDLPTFEAGPQGFCPGAVGEDGQVVARTQRGGTPDGEELSLPYEQAHPGVLWQPRELGDHRPVGRGAGRDHHAVHVLRLVAKTHPQGPRLGQDEMDRQAEPPGDRADQAALDEDGEGNDDDDDLVEPCRRGDARREDVAAEQDRNRTLQAGELNEAPLCSRQL